MYTKSILESTVNYFVPMGDKLVKAGNQALGMNYVDSPKTSKRKLKSKMAMAKSIQKAVKEGKMDSSFKQAAENMHTRAKSELAEQDFTNKQYLFEEVKKAVPLLDFMIPGTGTVATAAANVGTAKNIAEFAKESPDLVSTTIKSASFATPLIIGATSSLWLPIVAPWLGLAAAGAAVVVGGAAVADTVNYLRSNSSIYS